MKKIMFAVAFLVVFLTACGGGGGGGSDSGSNDNNNGGSTPVSFNLNNAVRVLAVNGHSQSLSMSVTAAAGEEESGETELVSVDEDGTISQASTGVNIKSAQRGPDGMLYVILNEQAAGSYLLKVNPETNGYTTIDTVAITDEVAGQNSKLQWDASYNLYYQTSTSIKKYDGSTITTMATLNDGESFGDWTYHIDGIYLIRHTSEGYALEFIDSTTLDRSTMRTGLTSAPWVRGYPIANNGTDQYVRAAVNDGGEYSIIMYDKDGVVSSQTLSGNNPNELSAIMNPNNFAECDGMFFSFSSQDGGYMFELYPYHDGNQIQVKVESLTVYNDVMYIVGESVGAQTWWEVWSDDHNWLSSRGMGIGYDGWEEQMAKFATATASIQEANTIYFTSINETDGTILVGERDTTDER